MSDVELDDGIKRTDAEDNLWYQFMLETIKFDNEKFHGWNWFLVVHHLHHNLGKLPKFNLTDIQNKALTGHWSSGVNIIDVPQHLRFLLEALLRDIGNPKEIQKIDFSKLLFNEKTSFSNFIFPVEVSFANAKFFDKKPTSNPFSLANLGVKPSVVNGFNGTIFSDNADFDNVIFNDGINFKKAIFVGKADFVNATFSGKADFDSALFYDDINFSHATLSSVADFNNITFSGKIQFLNATFARDVSFNNTIFSNKAILLSSTDFRNATFAGGASFNNATFSSVSTFSMNVDFTLATFAKTAYFKKVNFGGIGSAYFKGVKFSQGANFDDATFKKIANFDDVKFLGKSQFYKVKFLDGANFDKAEFSKDVNFDKAEFSEKVSFINAIFSEEIKFDGVTFEGHTDFINTKFKKYTPSSHKADFHSNTSWSWEVDLWPSTGKHRTYQTGEAHKARITKNQSAYENLSSHMKKLDKYNDEHFFYRQEMRCRQWRASYPTKCFYWLYEFLSDYGYGLKQALWGWFLHIFLGAILIGITTKSVYNKSCDLAGNFYLDMVVSFANAHGVLFLKDGALKKCYMKFNDLPVFNIIWGFQAVFGILFLFLLLLTLRIRFRLK